MQSTDVQTIVIGAGVVGLAVAAGLARAGREVFVLETENAIGQGVSSRNSEVIHAGIYYNPGSLKANVCVRGRHLLYEHCEKHNVAANRIGKLIVATADDELDGLNRLHQRAKKNGVDDITLIDKNTAMAMQPGLQCVAALHSPSTGIIDSHSLMVSLHGEIENHGGMVINRTPVETVEANGNFFRVATGGESATELTCNELINCTGLNAVSLARRIAAVNPDSIPNARFAKGNYFRLQGRAPFSSLIYPAPVTGGLGVHLTLDIGGQARFGPDVEWLEAPSTDDKMFNQNHFEYSVDPRRADSFYAAIRKYWPDLPDDALQPDYSGIRPKIERPGNNEIDFEISTETQHGIKGLINLYGIESPGLTSSLAIAEIVTSALTA